MLMNLLSSLLDAGGPVLVYTLAGIVVVFVAVALVVAAAAVLIIVLVVRNNKKKKAQTAQAPR